MAPVDVCTGRLFRRVFERMPARHGCKCRRLLMSAKADTPVQILVRTSFFSSFVHLFPRVSSGVGFLLVSSLADSPGFQAWHRPWMIPTFFLIPSSVPEGVVLGRFLLMSSLADSSELQLGHHPWMFPTFCMQVFLFLRVSYCRAPVDVFPGRLSGDLGPGITLGCFWSSLSKRLAGLRTGLAVSR
jgi:hypothetical protein